MTTQAIFPSLAGLEPTRQTLQLYSRVISAVPRAHGKFHPNWWHVSLAVLPDGLITNSVVPPDGRMLRLKMDLVRHEIILTANDGAVDTWSMREGTSSNQMADNVFGAVANLGLECKYDRTKFDNDDSRDYDATLANKFLTALANADCIFKAHRATLSGEVSPAQLWPHGFDLALDWFGTRAEIYQENGESKEYRSRLNLGFFPGSPGVEPYFYSNPWPFEMDALLGKTLPESASWQTKSWPIRRLWAIPTLRSDCSPTPGGSLSLAPRPSQRAGGPPQP
jgi:hypothetical protein